MTLNKPPVTAEATSAAQPVLDLQEEDIGELLGQLVRQADAVIARRPGVECGITLRRPSGSLTSACTGALATTLVDLQNRFHEGPALGAIADSHTVVLGDLSQDGRWPRFSRTALAQGIRSAVSVPLWAEDQGNAVLSVCANRTAAFSEDEISAMERFALDAARRLRPALRIADLAETLQNLYAAIANRTPIDLAVGIVMAQNQCNQTAAVGLLRRASTSRNVKMRDLAQSIIAAVPGQDAVSVHFEP
jgi:GAF domain-containing protein